MLPAAVVGVITVGVDGRAVRSAKATIPFLARFTGQGVEAGATAPVIVSVKVPVPVPEAVVAVRLILNVPDLVGVPEIAPVVGLTLKPAGSEPVYP
jgi:hypothetical protein